jgi:hypothetical protein
MAQPKLTVTEIDHINQLIKQTDVALDHYRRLYGVQIDRIFEQEWGPYDNFVFKLGSALIEVFCPVPPDRMNGNMWQAVLWRVPNLEEAIESMAARDVRLVNVELEEDRRWAFTDPRDTFGMVMQLEDRTGWDKSITPNPLGVTRLDGLTIAVNDADEASSFFQGLITDAEVTYRQTRPRLDATAVGVRMGGYNVEFISPAGDGEISRFLDHYRQRIRTATFAVESLDRLKSHFAEHGVKLRDGDIPDTLMIAPEDNLDCQMQFREA